jgi:5-methylcytosine-specific restriction endonuclease McrA
VQLDQVSQFIRKTCPLCGEIRSAETDFHANKNTKDGKCVHCKVCAKARTRAYYRANKEKVKAYNRCYTEANRDLARKWSREYARRNYEKNAAAFKNWRSDNRERSREHCRSRRRKMAPLPAELIAARFEVYGNCCAYCGLSGPLEADHVKAVKRGGKHILSNIRPACRTCNASKASRKLHLWLADPNSLRGQYPPIVG